ncbi:hypothetical protein BLL52_0389 [Rhodoferax antarcticus ANT.BR]|uniref:Uncharacterized protein n=1 Tax=Rhodoferax antarcticus ANT.BR TaxID=1111071 RepID=A0A1Q8YJ66_9BURK|nr:hypothetical protein BLL52_0389 [Rhodoferax antarcticus ANT.BR]
MGKPRRVNGRKLPNKRKNREVCGAGVDATHVAMLSNCAFQWHQHLEYSFVPVFIPFIFAIP